MKTILRFFLIFTLTIFATSNARSQSVFWSADYYFGCEPLMVNFFNGSDTIGTTGILFWEWHLPDMVLYTRDIPPQALPAGYHPITLKLFDDTGPGGEYTDYIDVYPDGDSFWPMDGDMLCPDKPVNFHVEDGVSWYSTTWDFGDGSVIIRDDDYVDHTYPAPGSYTVTLTVDHYCGPDTVVQTINIEL